LAGLKNLFAMPLPIFFDGDTDFLIKIFSSTINPINNEIRNAKYFTL